MTKDEVRGQLAATPRRGEPPLGSAGEALKGRWRAAPSKRRGR
jgi:hypothetical protein